MQKVIADYPYPALAHELKSGLNAARLELACRKAKEDFFGIEVDWQDDYPRYYAEADLFAAERERLHARISFSPRDMAEILNAPQAELDGQSWLQAFRAKLVSVMDQIRRPPQTVVLTGGASRMPFARAICMEVLGHDRIIQGQEPELTIAKGLALAARTNHLVSGFRAEVDDFISSGEVKIEVAKQFPLLATRLGAAFAKDKMEDHVIPAFLKWRDNEIATLNGVTKWITNSIQKELAGESSTWAKKIAVEWQNGISAQLEERTRPICTRYQVPPDALTLDQVEVRGTKVVPTVNPRTAIDAVDGIGNVLATIVSAMILGVVVSIGLALAVGGPITWTVTALAGAYAVFVGKEAAMEAMLDANIYPWARRLKSAESLRNKLRSDAPAFEQKLATAFTAEFTAKSGGTLPNQISDEVENQLRIRADDAEMNIS